jgi:hypothetical protein
VIITVLKSNGRGWREVYRNAPTEEAAAIAFAREAVIYIGAAESQSIARNKGDKHTASASSNNNDAHNDNDGDNNDSEADKRSLTMMRQGIATGLSDDSGEDNSKKGVGGLFDSLSDKDNDDGRKGSSGKEGKKRLGKARKVISEKGAKLRGPLNNTSAIMTTGAGRRNSWVMLARKGTRSLPQQQRMTLMTIGTTRIVIPTRQSQHPKPKGWHREQELNPPRKTMTHTMTTTATIMTTRSIGGLSLHQDEAKLQDSLTIQVKAAAMALKRAQKALSKMILALGRNNWRHCQEIMERE